MCADNILSIPEIVGLDARGALVRIPPECDVPLTNRVRAIIDTAAFRRLSQIPQLGLVSLVYPGARHTRFEHSLGVYRLALLVLKRLAHDERFVQLIPPREATVLIVAALLHDIGHYPYCHIIEDLQLPGIPPHEEAAADYICREELAQLLRDDWGIEPDEILALLHHQPVQINPGESQEEFALRRKRCQLLRSILSGPIDIDKMDYLFRDSLGAGVPYGRHVDQERLIGSLTLSAAGDGLAISEKGKTAAELMVFARYVMFSEVYWHHTVRSASVMFQRAFELLSQQTDAIEIIRNAGLNPAYFHQPTNCPEVDLLLQSLFGARRTLYKRVKQLSIMEEPELYLKLAGRPYPQLRQIATQLAGRFGVSPNEILIDAPPVEKEIEFKIDVYYGKQTGYRPLEEVSPVVRALAKDQFDDYVKRVRLFAHPRIASQLRESPELSDLLCDLSGIEGDIDKFV